MNRIEITGTFEKEPEMKNVDRPTGSVDLCTVSLTYFVKRGKDQVKQWVDVEAVGPLAFALADQPVGSELTIKGELRRAAWKSRKDDSWCHRHYIDFETSDALITQPGATDNSDIPF